MSCQCCPVPNFGLCLLCDLCLTLFHIGKFISQETFKCEQLTFESLSLLKVTFIN